MHIDQLARAYAAETDEELLQLAGEINHLTPDAATALKSELARRHLDSAEVFQNRELASTTAQLGRAPDVHMSAESSGVGGLINDVLRIYYGHFWLFNKIVLPAVALGCIAVLIGRNESREISRHLGRGLEIFNHKGELIEIALAKFGGLFASWMAFTLSFSAICVVVQKLATGEVPSIAECFAPIRGRIGPLLRLSSLLFIMLLITEAVSLLLIEFGVFWVLGRLPIHVSGFLIWLISCVCYLLGFLIMSRFALSVPALVLDHFKVGESIFRSDEYTERSWLILAALLAKSLVGGYVAGMIPFWIAWSLFATVPWPTWFPWALTAASIAAVTPVEPPMFIGFALLYLRRSKFPAASEPVAQGCRGALALEHSTSTTVASPK